MFEAFDTAAFGKYMKSVRKSLNLTQHDVVNMCNVNVETLRRLEKGLVIPKYDTLEYLSDAYKMDVMSLFSFFRSSEALYNFYNYMDEIIIEYNLEKLASLENEYNEILSDVKLDKIINNTQMDQMALIVRGIKEFSKERYHDCLATFIGTMKLSNKEFEIEKYNQFKYTELDYRILLLIALGLSEVEELEHANEILELILKKFTSTARVNENDKKLLIKVYSNLSYNCHCLDDFERALKFADKGIEYCNKNHTTYGLFLLYYRRGVAKYLLKKRNYRKDFEYCIMLLEMQKNKKLIEVYKQVTKDKYDIDL